MALAAERDFVMVTGEEHLGQHFQPMRISFSPDLTPAAGVLCSCHRNLCEEDPTPKSTLLHAPSAPVGIRSSTCLSR